MATSVSQTERTSSINIRGCHGGVTNDIISLVRDALIRAILNGKPRAAAAFAETLARHNQRRHGGRPDAGDH